METFTKETLHIDDVVVYLKNERTGSSTIRKYKFIGHIVEFTKTKVEIKRLSPPDTFVTPEECVDYGVDTVRPDEIVHIIISKHKLDDWLCLPHTIGNITFYDKKELVEWIKNQQELNGQLEESYKRLQDEINGEVNGIPIINPTF